MTEATTGLISCLTCNHEIGTQADSCPQCGSPNTWVHPRIQAMYEAKTFNTTRSFRFWHKGAEVWGESLYHSAFAYVGVIIIFVIAMFSALFSLFIGPAIGGVVMVFFWKATAKKDTFRANLVTRTFESSKPQFWQPVAEFLGVRK